MAQLSDTFKEEQKISSAPWFVWIMVGLQVFFLIGFLSSVYDGEVSGAANFVARIFGASIPALVIWWVRAADVKLVTEISREGVAFRWHPFSSETKPIAWTEIDRVEYNRYRFVGYGWRFSIKYGEINNVWGRQGLLITKKNGTKLLIGTQRNEEEVSGAIEKFRAG